MRTLLASVQAAAGDVAAAVETLRTGVKATSNTVLLFRVGSTLEQARDFDAAAAVYSQMIERDVQADAAANNLAMLLVTHRADNPESLGRALALVDRFVGSQELSYLDTLGWVQLKNGKSAHAVQTLEKALTMTDRNPELQYHLGMAYLALGRAEDAKPQLAAALEANQPFPGRDEARRALQGLK